MVNHQIFQSRRKKLGEAILEAGLNAIVLNPGPSLTYFTGLNFHLSERPIIVILLPEQPPAIVLPELEKAKVSNLHIPITAFPYGEDPSTWVDAFRQTALNTGLKNSRIGVEPRGLRFLELQLLEQGFPQTSFQPAEEVIAALRMHKDEQEAAFMQQAVDVAEKALGATLPFIKPSNTEKQIATELSMQLIRNGSNPGLPFFPIVSGGPNSANLHATPSDRHLEPGDLLVIDYGANVEGYFSDITRTFAIGEVDPECHKVAHIVLEANQAGREAIRPGVTAASVDNAARGVIDAAGYGAHFIHRTGHGLGLEVHEEPYIRADNDLILETGMTFTIEPGIYLPNRFGLRIEDNIIVTQDGVRSFTSLPRELIKLPVA